MVRGVVKVSKTERDAVYMVYRDVYNMHDNVCTSRRTRQTHSTLPEWMDHIRSGADVKSLAPATWLREGVLDWKLDQLCAQCKVPGGLKFEALNTDKKGTGAHWMLKVVVGGETYYFDPHSPCIATRPIIKASGSLSPLLLRVLLGDTFDMKTLQQPYLNNFDCGVLVCLAAEAVAAAVQGHDHMVGWTLLESRARLAVEFMASTLTVDGVWAPLLNDNAGGDDDEVVILSSTPPSKVRKVENRG
jgi:hypothetical protein